MALNLSKTVVEFLRDNSDKKFTARQIAEWIFEKYPEKCRQKQNRSTATINLLDSDAALLQQIISEIGAQRPRMQKACPQIKTTEGRPRKYYFTESTDVNEVESIEQYSFSAGKKGSAAVMKEYDLYPILSNFLFAELGIYSKRIDEKRSINARGLGGNKWLYPDLVGMEDLSEDWHREIKDCVQQYADKKTKLWAFEVKLLVNCSNVRESFFQTVSNSSWANFAYLVASEIKGGDALKELRMLSGLHGVGFILIDLENLSESQIMIPAKERSEVDWSAANRIAEENKDFLEYIRLIRQFYQTGEMRAQDWDGGKQLQ